MLIEHHTKYIETHGIDETVLIDAGEHKKIDHRKLFPNISVEELNIISMKASNRKNNVRNKKINRKYYIISKMKILKIPRNIRKISRNTNILDIKIDEDFSKQLDMLI